MFQRSKILISVGGKTITCKKFIHLNGKLFQELSNSVWKTSKVLGRTTKSNTQTPLEIKECPDQVDIVIIGGGPMGSSTAYWLKEKTGQRALNIAVIERDLTYQKCSAVLSNGGLRQQFSLPENIELSLFSAKFLQNIKQKLGDDADINLRSHGYLCLGNESQVEQIIANSRLQNELGAKNKVLSKNELKIKFPYMNLAGVEVGCLGMEYEGWFDPWLYLQVLKKNAMAKGTRYINAEVVDFEFETNGDKAIPKRVTVKFPNAVTKNISFTCCVLAAGCESGRIGKLLNIGTGLGPLSTPIPVEPRKRFVFAFDCAKDPPPAGTPFVIDTNGTFHRREGLGTNFIGGYSPKVGEPEPNTDNLDVDHDLFNDIVWPDLAHRVPAFEAIKIIGAWGGYYDFNYFDENGIIGRHPYYKNLYIATGFSGHGIMQSCAVGNSVSELLLDGTYKTIDLTRLGFERLVNNTPMLESLII